MNEIVKKNMKMKIAKLNIWRKIWRTYNAHKYRYKINSYKKTVQYDPSKSETFRAIQEEGYGNGYAPQEVTIPVQTKVFHANRMVPGKKPVHPAPVSRTTYNVVNTSDETIRQSGSFNRLMYSVLGASDY